MIGSTREARSPAGFTGVAGTAVLGTRLAIADYHTAAAALLAWSRSLLGRACRAGPAALEDPNSRDLLCPHRRHRSIAVLGAILAVSYRAGWLVSAAAAALVLGLAFYVFTAARFDLRQLITGHGDHWIAGGRWPSAPSPPATSPKPQKRLGSYSQLHQVLTTSTLVLWCLAMVWLLPLITCEILRPRLRYDIRRWATVFPLGIYAAAASHRRGRRHHRDHRLRPRLDVGRVQRPGCSRSPGCSITPCSCCVVSLARALPRTRRGQRTLLRGT